jgi:hypothetical protein
VPQSRGNWHAYAAGLTVRRALREPVQSVSRMVRIAAVLTPASSHAASHPDHDSYAYGNSENDQRAVLYLARHPVQCRLLIGILERRTRREHFSSCSRMAVVHADAFRDRSGGGWLTP